MNRLLWIFLLFSFLSYSQSRVKTAKNNLQPKSSAVKTEHTESNSNDETSSSLFAELLTEAALLVSYKILLGEFESRHFSTYPYYFSNVNGNYDYGYQKGDKRQLLQLSSYYLMDERIQSIETNASYRFIPILGVELSNTMFFENYFNSVEQLNYSSLILNYYRVRERFLNLWWGIGVTYVGNEIKTSGFSYQLGTEIFFLNPISIDGLLKQSFINQNEINEYKVRMNYHHKKITFQMGYNYYAIGEIEVSGISLGATYSF